MNKRSTFVVFGIAVLLRVLFVWRQPLWYDENFSLLLARLPLDRMLAATISDVHPPLFYLTIWPLMHIPGAPAWLIRVPSVIFSILSVALFWAILQKMVASPTVRVAALILMAVTPANIYYAQEGRMYALLEFLFLMAVWSMLERKWAFFAMDIVLLLYTHNAAIFYAASIYLVAMLRDVRDWRKLTLALTAAGAAWLPWVLIMFSQMTTIDGSYWILPVAPGRVLYSFYQLFFTQSPFVAGEILQATVFFGWLLFALFYMLRKKSPEVRQFLILAFVPALLMVIVSLIWQPIFMYRLLIPCIPWMCVLLAWPVEWVLSNTRRQGMAAIFIVPLLLVNLPLNYNPRLYRGDDGDTTDLLEIIDERWQAGDVVYHTSDGTMINFLPYTSTPYEDNFVMPSCDATYGSLTPETRSMMGVETVSLDALDWSRAWIVTVQNTRLEPACKMESLAPYLSGPVEVVQCLPMEMGRVCLYLVQR